MLRMKRGRTIAGALVSFCALCGAGTLYAQQPPPGGAAPTQPAPVPSQPPRPGQPPAPGPAQPPQPGPAQPPVPGLPTPPSPTKEPEPEPTPPPETVTEPQRRVPEDLLRSPAPTTLPPRVFVGPDLFNPPPPQGWLTLTPSFTLSGEYNDNIFLSSRDRRSDGIIGFTPGLTLSIQRPAYRLLAGYTVSGEVYLRENELSDFGKTQRFFGDFFYQVSPRVTFSLSDEFMFSRDSNALTSSGASVGRQDAWRNTLTPSLRWDVTANTGLNFQVSHSILRFDSSEFDSDTYRATVGVDHRLTQRLMGMLDMNVGYIDVQGESAAWTYTPTIGFRYDITRRLRGFITGGPSIVERGGDTEISPAIAAGLTQTFRFGTVQLGYDRAITAETVGISDRQAIFGSVGVSTLLRGLQLYFTPRYSIVDTDVAGGSGDEIKTLTLNLGATYQIARNINLIASYTFFNETSDGNRGDIDQNRVFLGVQYAFPINFY